jgi:thiamine-monophosphate kinase
VSLGIGDDTASFKARPGHEILVTCDCVVEGRHFLSHHISAMNLGRRSMMLNISDIGAMGGHPLYALVSLGLKNETLLRDIEDLYRGFLSELNPFSASIIGGNLTKSGDGIFIDITLLGEVEEGRAVRRSGARPGDAILVTGYPGQSAAGLQLLLQSLVSEDHPLVRAYNNPCHRAREGRAVALTGCATAMIDTSDGFLGDLGHICETSRVGALLSQEKFPISSELREAAKLLNKEPGGFFLGDSDDYQLIITCRLKDVERVRSAIALTYTGPVTEVGHVTKPDKGIRAMLADGSEKILSANGWDHFR